MTEFHHACVHLFADAVEDLVESVFGHDIVDGGEEEELGFFREELAAGWVDEFDFLDFISEEFDADGEFLVCGPDLDCVSS